MLKDGLACAGLINRPVADHRPLRTAIRAVTRLKKGMSVEEWSSFGNGRAAQMRVPFFLAFLLALNQLFVGPCSAQASKSPVKATTAAASREQQRLKMNENLLILMCGQLGAPYIQLGHDISVVVNDGNNLRVLPVVSDGALTNVRDILFLKGVDLGITTVQIINALRSSGEVGPNLDRQIAYIAPLSVDTLHVLARPGINSMQDLKGKRVSFNSKGSGTARFSPAVFKALGIEVTGTTMAQGDAIQAMRNGELDATVCSCPKPLPAFPDVKPEWGFKFLEVPYLPEFEQDYVPASITHEDYPNLIANDSKVQTIATSTILIAFSWQRNTQRYKKIEKFVDAFFSKFDKLREPPRHPAWRNVNVAATVRGWRRFPAAQEWLDRQPK
jgi:TRAP transporter TAXI family solute receptor